MNVGSRFSRRHQDTYVLADFMVEGWDPCVQMKAKNLRRFSSLRSRFGGRAPPSFHLFWLTLTGVPSKALANLLAQQRYYSFVLAAWEAS